MSAKPCMDHQGKHYPTVRAMCAAYGISWMTFDSRLRAGWPLEAALRTPILTSVFRRKSDTENCGRRSPVDDSGKIRGNYLQLLLAYHGVLADRSLFKRRLRQGWSVRQALLTPGRCNIPYDRGGAALFGTTIGCGRTEAA